MASNKSEIDGGNLGDQNNPGSCFATPKQQQQQQPRRPVPVRVASDDDDDDYDANSGRRIGLDEPEATNVDGGGGRRRRRAKKRIRSLYGVSPDCRFGPKGTILDSSCKFLSIPDPTGQKLEWHNPPLSVLIVRKISDNALLSPFRDVLNWLILKKNMIVFVEDNVLEDFSLLPKEEFQDIRNKLYTFREEKDDLTDKIDFIICLGGDGTLLHASSLFQRSMPPVMSFHLGSLGFLAPFQFSNFQEQITQVLEGNAALLLRSRLKCVLCRKDSEHLKVPHVKNIDYQKESACNHILVLNEVVMDRGPSPYLCNIDLYVEGRIVTSVQGDGVIISTPTGSTAYAVAAGASIMHPNVPAIMITPICPHSLSFRPIVVPAGVEIKLMVSPEARNSAWVSFDGRNRQELKIGDCVRITTAIHPLPSLCMKDPIDDWFESLAECLHWNLRKPQQMLSSVSSLTSVESVDLDAVS